MPTGSSGFGTAPEPIARQVDDLARGPRHAEPVELLVEDVEALLERVEAALHLVGVECHGDLVALAVVAHVCRVRDRACVSRDALVVEPLGGALAEALEDRADLGRLGLAEHPDVGLGELVAEVGGTRSPIAQRRPGAGGAPTGNDPMISATALA